MTTPPNGIPCKQCGEKLCSGDPSSKMPDKCPHCGKVYRVQYTSNYLKELKEWQEKVVKESIDKVISMENEWLKANLFRYGMHHAPNARQIYSCF